MDLISLVSEELAYYILQYSAAVIPGIGCFEAVCHSARIDQDSGVLIAPSNSIAFTAEPSEDTGFETYLDTHYPEQNLLESFAVQFQSQIEESSSVSLPEVGAFTQDEDATLQFAFEEEEDLLDDFSFSAIALKPIQKITKESEPVEANLPGASIADEATEMSTARPEATSKRKRPYLRVGMITSVLLLTLAFFFSQKEAQTETVLAQKVSAKYNVSPQNMEGEIIIASNELEEYVAEISEEEHNSIVERQEKMSVEAVAPTLHSAVIVTNTFSNLDYMQKQLEKIEAQGYKSVAFLKANGLTATHILLQYESEADLTAELEKIKKSFPRSKLKK